MVFHFKQNNSKGILVANLRVEETAIEDSTSRAPYLCAGNNLLTQVVDFMKQMRSVMGLTPSQILMMYLDDKWVPLASTLEEVYKEFKDDDGFLYFSFKGISFSLNSYQLGKLPISTRVI
ncbi:hypothetical protein RF11_12644 [Thelohanellus kitauei]|uniref:Autophagy-related protein n=1 Tax=Thelohanellus kitauei TaxID=669202 RepID=A0A0C2NLI7_THEKT|nr:hypothetical protein RF11_12644 [Thelohanellus kitauei]